MSVVLEDGSVHKQPGRLLFTDLTVDATSGQVTLRAEVPNPGHRCCRACAATARTSTVVYVAVPGRRIRARALLMMVM